MRAGTFLTLGLVAVVAACGEPDQGPQQGGLDSQSAVGDSTVTRRVYDRNFVFASLDGDSVFIVPWMLHTVEEPDSVMREARAWLARGDDWDGFFAERWWTPPTREPARPLPRAGLRLLVGEGDDIDGILYSEGQRSLEVVLGESTRSWTGARGGAYEVLAGTAFLADQQRDGLVLDMARASVGPGAPGGDWAFLLSDDDAFFVLTADEEHGGDNDPEYRGWGDHDGNEMQWTDVRVTWGRTEAFPPARRDVPVEWELTTDDDSFSGNLEAISAELQPGQGPGPLLPVRALYVVTGELATERGRFDVRGILVHERR